MDDLPLVVDFEEVYVIRPRDNTFQGDRDLRPGSCSGHIDVVDLRRDRVVPIFVEHIEELGACPIGVLPASGDVFDVTIGVERLAERFRVAACIAVKIKFKNSADGVFFRAVGVGSGPRECR